MTILSLDKVSLAYGHHPLLKDVNFNIAKGERVCLVGRNGTGKSTLFKVITGAAQADEGEIWRPETLRISYLEQEVPTAAEDSVYDVVASGLGELGQLLSAYHAAIIKAADDPGALDEMAELQQRIEVLDGWNVGQKVDSVISRLDLPADKRLADCSGGVKRRVLLGRALVSEPDLLLLDEPTNHMDISAINWLEEFLLGFQGALIFITHDRTFLKHLATRIIELDRGTLTSFPGDYDAFLVKKEELLAAEEKANALFDKKLAEHEAWIRQGVKARRTRNEGRVRRLIAMRKEHSQRISTQGKVSLNVEEADRSGKLVADLSHVNFSYGDHPIIRDLSTRIIRGDRIGIIGPNGSGKSTLIKLILGELTADNGEVALGTKLEQAYFDQHRSLLKTDKTVRENICEGSDFINVRGRSRHVISYLKDFLFPPERVDSPVKILSGGERNRLLLAKLFTQPANMLILDEPTNDLDVDTLELLEELLSDFEGTLLLVSHDRAFLDNVVTSTLVFEEDHRIGEYVGGYADWLRQRKRPMIDIAKEKAAETSNDKTIARKSETKQKLSYKEQRELETLPKRIEELEQELQDLDNKINQADFYQQDKDNVTTTLSRIEQLNQELQQVFERWEFLDNY